MELKLGMDTFNTTNWQCIKVEEITSSSSYPIVKGTSIEAENLPYHNLAEQNPDILDKLGYAETLC
jgi:hypothetical protein